MKKTLRQYLEGQIPEEKLSLVNRSFEIIGDIAITEIPEEINEYDKQIGEAILQTNRVIKTVLKKVGIHEGEFRTQKLEVIAGENKKETTYLENGVRLVINPETVYFSPRLSTEREELMNELDFDKRVLVMFSGAGPYTFVALKKQPELQRITSIEINPEGHKYALKSLEENKNILKRSELYENLLGFLRGNTIRIDEKQLIKNLTSLKCHFINGDVREEIKNLHLKFEDKTSLEEDNGLIKNFKPKETVQKLNELTKKELHFNFDTMKDPEDLLPFLIYFTHKFDFIITLDGASYTLNTPLKKGLLLNYLEQDCTTPFEKIGLYDEIYMPLPKDAELFLDSAFEAADEGAIIHMYDFVHENDFPHVTEGAVVEAGKKAKREVEILQTRKVGQYSPRKFRVCCDFIVR